jgi:FAD/FMN-containing dehydrogenase
MVANVNNQPAVTALREAVCEAATNRLPLRIRAGGTKDFYGNATTGSVLDPRSYAGILAYEPSELVVTACAGTPLTELENLLAEHGQMLAFEPPHFGRQVRRSADVSLPGSQARAARHMVPATVACAISFSGLACWMGAARL